MEQYSRKGSNSKLIKILGLTAVTAILALSAVAWAMNGKSSQTVASGEQTSASATPTASTAPAATTSSYKDGTYSASGTYRTPQSTETVALTVTLKGGIVTDSSISMQPVDHESRQYQQMFAGGYKDQVIGKPIDTIRLSQVSGSSLTSGGFNAALEKIKSQAKA